MIANRPIARRTFLAELGHGAVAVALIGVAGCGSAGRLPTPSGKPLADTSPVPGCPTMDVSLPRMAPGTRRGSDGELTWERIGLGFDLACPFVAAYLLVRSGESALVDTGIEGNADAIEASLTDLGLGWVDLGHVILTHWHGDHTGSAPEILLRAPNATGYAGAEDIARLPVPLELTALADGDRVFGLEIVATPGHTPGSISVFDPVARLLVAGDAVMATDGAPTLPPAQSTEDMGLAKRSIVKMGALDFETLLVGHGEPIESGAGAMVASLGAN